MDGSWHRFARLGPTLCVGLAACGPRHSDEPCREGLVDSAVIIRDEADIAALPRVNAIVSLEIADTDLEDLSGLECVEFVESLTIRGNRRLRDLAGLDSLQAVRTRACFGEDPGDDCKENQFPPENHPPGVAELRIDDNDALESLQGLGSLMYVAGSMRVRRNPQLRSLEGLSSLFWIGVPRTIGSTDAQLEIADNPRLSTLRGIESLEGWALRLMNLTVRGNRLLTELETGGLDDGGFSVSVLGVLALDDLPSLSDLAPLSKWFVGGIDLRSLPSLTEIPENLFAAEISKMEDEPQAEAYLRKSQLVLLDNAALSSLVGFSTIGSIGGPLVVGRNASLASLTGLEAVREIDGPVHVRPPALGLATGQSIAIFSNPRLVEIDALERSRGGALEWVHGDRAMIRENLVLGECQAESVAAQFPELSWEIELNGSTPCE